MVVIQNLQELAKDSLKVKIFFCFYQILKDKIEAQGNFLENLFLKEYVLSVAWKLTETLCIDFKEIFVLKKCLFHAFKLLLFEVIEVDVLYQHFQLLLECYELSCHVNVLLVNAVHIIEVDYREL